MSLKLESESDVTTVVATSIVTPARRVDLYLHLPPILELCVWFHDLSQLTTVA
jgi:hypothetical protein